MGPLRTWEKSLAVCCGKTAHRDQESCWKYRFLAGGQKQGPAAEWAVLGHTRYGCIFWREPKCRCLRWRTHRSKETNPSGGWLFPFLLRVYLWVVWLAPGGAHSCCAGDDGLLPLGPVLAACPWVPAGSLYQFMALAMTCQHLHGSNSSVNMALHHHQPLPNCSSPGSSKTNTWGGASRSRLSPSLGNTAEPENLWNLLISCDRCKINS